jgi:hypothetical protein
MEVVVTSIDYNPPELTDQLPFSFALVRMMPGPDRPDYWLGRLREPLRWIDDNFEKFIEHVVVCARWAGTQIVPGFSNLPINLAYVIDPSLLDDEVLVFEKCRYVATAIASDVAENPNSDKLTEIIAGNIARAFGFGKRS